MFNLTLASLIKIYSIIIFTPRLNDHFCLSKLFFEEVYIKIRDEKSQS